jgi:hypothetical protein
MGDIRIRISLSFGQISIDSCYLSLCRDKGRMRGNLSDTIDPTEKYGEVVLLILLHGVLLLRL